MSVTKERIIELLTFTKRKGIKGLIAYLEGGGFFESPASARYHGSYAGGLAEHSFNVYDLLTHYNSELRLGIDDETMIIAALLHDVCKMGAYVKTKAGDGWTNNRNKDKGHALLSLERIKKFITLTELEELMIKYHAGIYGLIEFDEKQGEYPLRGGAMANAWYHNPIVKVMYFCDELATLQEKADANKWVRCYYG